MIDAFERRDVAVLASLGDDDVVNADVAGVGRVDPDPGAAEEFDSRVAPADNRFSDGRVGIGVQVTRHVARGYAQAPQQRHGHVGQILTDTLSLLPHLLGA